MTDLHVATAAFVTRRYTSRPPELRDVGGAKHIAGYASVFNKMSRNLGGFVERIDRRAFDQPMVDGWPDVICRYNHDDNYLLGTTHAGTLSLNTDETGLFYDCLPPSFRADILELCMRGDVNQSSFAFRVPEEGDYWERSGPGGMPLRVVLNTELVDVAPVNTPAYPDATASARSIDNDLVQSLARLVEGEMTEVRSYLDSHDNNVAKFFKRSDAAAPKTEAPVTDARAAKATYSDMETCGDCGSQNEYGKFCSGCGSEMSAPSKSAASPKFCTSCGGKMAGKRADHVCETENRAVIKKRGELDDSVFAYIEPGHDSEKVDGRTPDKYRHFPLTDESHVRNALSQAPKSPFGAKALPKIKAAAKKFGITMEEQKSLILDALAELRDALNEDDELRGDLPPWLQKGADKGKDAKGKDAKGKDAKGDDSDDDTEDDEDDEKGAKSDSKKPAKTEKKSGEPESEERADVLKGDGDTPAEDDEEDDDTKGGDDEEAKRAAAAEKAEYADRLLRLTPYPELEDLTEE